MLSSGAQQMCNQVRSGMRGSGMFTLLPGVGAATCCLCFGVKGGTVSEGEREREREDICQGDAVCSNSLVPLREC